MSAQSIDLLLLHRLRADVLDGLSPVTLLSALLGFGLLIAELTASDKQDTAGDAGLSPPTVPYTIPLLRSTYSFAFDGLIFLSHLQKTFSSAPAVRVKLLNEDVYVVQGPKAITEVFRNQTLTMTRAYGIALQHCFGMAQRAVDVYVQDTSGSRAKPISGSNVPPSRRVGFPTHENLAQGLQLGQGLEHTTARFQAALQETMVSKLESVVGAQDGGWVEFDDFTAFVERTVGTAVLHCLFGPLLLSQGNFLDDLFDYDKDVMPLIRQLPRFLAPRAYRRRDQVLRAIKSWHRQALALSKNGSQANPGPNGSDPCWGCDMTRRRYAKLAGLPDQDTDAIASTDLALIWASITNVVPSAVTMCINVFGDAPLTSEIRSALDAHDPTQRLNVRMLEKQALLQAVYAETLRFGVQIHVPRCSSNRTVPIGNMRLPPGKLLFVNTWAAHTDPRVWNSQDGARSLHDFWPKRFLVVPGDHTSGPARDPKLVAQQQQAAASTTEPRFSVEGLEGAWVPYGGGHHACPGRLLAKRVMLLTLATLASSYDVDITADAAARRFESPRFGFGVKKPAGRVPFRLRRRSPVA